MSILNENWLVGFMKPHNVAHCRYIDIVLTVDKDHTLIRSNMPILAAVHTSVLL